MLTAAGGGRWMHLLNLMRGGNSGLATLTGGGRLAQDVRDGSIAAAHLADGSVTTPKLADQGVTAPKLAPGAAAANLGYTPVNRAGDTMTGVLTVAPNIGQVLNLKGGSSDHVYLGFYARSANQNARSGYIGYSSAGNNNLSVVNEVSGGKVAVVASALLVPSEIMNDSPLNVLTTASAAQAINAASIRLGSDYGDLNSYGILPGQILAKGGHSSTPNTPPRSPRSSP